MNAVAEEVYKKYKKNCAVVFGKYNHLNFVIREEKDFKRILVLDLIPPKPGYLEDVSIETVELNLIKKDIIFDFKSSMSGKKKVLNTEGLYSIGHQM